VSSNSTTLAIAASKLGIYRMVCDQFWAPDDGRRNRLSMKSIGSNKEYCIALHLAGYTYKIY